MSWPRLLGLLLPLLLAGGLSGCAGYSPLYGTNAAGVRNSEVLSRVQVGSIEPGMVGYDVRNGLLDQINPDGEPAQPLHRLEVSLTPNLSGLLVQPDAAITRYNYTLLGRYRLIDLATGKVEAQGDVTGTSAYNVVTNEYATVVARRDAERRAAHSVSDGIALRVAVFLKSKSS
jgi:LPS-assembly lipoprotein